MLVHDIIHFLIDNGIKEFVLDSEFTNLNEDIRTMGADAVLISDVRSATFYAFGLAEKKNAQIVLIVRYEYLASSFTGLMESWFQKRQLLVIAVSSKVLNCSLECYKSCTSNQYKIQNINEFEICFNNSVQDRPSIFLVEETIPYSKLSYSIDIGALEKELPDEYKLYIYSPVTSNKSDRKNTIYINPEYKYGIISKFLGHCIFDKKKSVLLTDISVFKLEMNVFNSRYIDQRFNLIVTGIKPTPNTIQWLNCNNIETVFCEVIENAMAEIFQKDKPVVAFVETQEVETVCTQTL